MLSASTLGTPRYVIDVPGGWVVQRVQPCVAVTGRCGTLVQDPIGSEDRMYFAIERADGGCGRVAIQVTRLR